MSYQLEKYRRNKFFGNKYCQLLATATYAAMKYEILRNNFWLAQFNFLSLLIEMLFKLCSIFNGKRCHDHDIFSLIMK